MNKEELEQWLKDEIAKHEAYIKKYSSVPPARDWVIFTVGQRSALAQVLALLDGVAWSDWVI